MVDCWDPGCRHGDQRARHPGLCPEDPERPCRRRLARVPDRFTVRVVGVTFCPGYPVVLGQLELETLRPLIDGQVDEPVPVAAELRRNPDNEHDPMAVEVHVPALGQQVGHLDRHAAARIAPLLDAGEEWAAVIVEVAVSPNDPSHPGLRVQLRRVDP